MVRVQETWIRGEGERLRKHVHRRTGLKRGKPRRGGNGDVGSDTNLKGVSGREEVEIEKVWSSHYRKHMEVLESLQALFTRMIPGLDGFSYRYSMDRLGLYSLERRRLW